MRFRPQGAGPLRRPLLVSPDTHLRISRWPSAEVRCAEGHALESVGSACLARESAAASSQFSTEQAFHVSRFERQRRIVQSAAAGCLPTCLPVIPESGRSVFLAFSEPPGQGAHTGAGLLSAHRGDNHERGGELGVNPAIPPAHGSSALREAHPAQDLTELARARLFFQTLTRRIELPETLMDGLIAYCW